MESITEVVNMNRVSADSETVYIGRPSKWGNPYKSGVDGTRNEVIKMYEVYIRNNQSLLNDIEELRGKKLACWCAPHKKCHGDILVKILNERSIDELIVY